MAKEIFLTSASFVRNLTNISDNMQDKFLQSAIRESQEIDLQQVIGTRLLTKLKDLIETQKIDEDDNVYYKTLLQNCQYFLAYNVVSRICKISSFHISNNGVSQVNDEHITNATMKEVNELETFYKNKADFYQLLLQKFLIDEYKRFPELETDRIKNIKANLYSMANTSSIFLGNARGKYNYYNDCDDIPSSEGGGGCCEDCVSEDWVKTWVNSQGFINHLKTINNQSLIGIGNINIECEGEHIVVPKFISLYKEDDYLYKAEYSTDLEYDWAYDYFNNHFKGFDLSNFACTSFRNGNVYARNYDWYYDNTVEFVIKTPNYGSRYANIAVCSVPSLTKDIVESKEYNPSYDLLPFMVMDGINESGVFCNINVVPSNEEGWIPTTGTTAEIEKKVNLCMLMIPRYVIDNFPTAQMAVSYIRDYCSIYAPQTELMSAYEAHFMIGDGNKTFIVEFKNNEIVINEVGEGKDYPAIMTNFIVDGTETDADGIVYESVSPYGSGLERYNILYKNLSAITDVNTAKSYMTNELKYTNTYSDEIEPIWLTEFVGDYGSYQLTVEDAKNNPSKFDNVLAIARGYFENRQRGDGKTWQTVHTSVYNISGKTLTLVSQENNHKSFVYSLNDSQGGGSGSYVGGDYISINDNVISVVGLENYDDTEIQGKVSTMSGTVNTHTENTTVHITAQERADWNYKQDKGNYPTVFGTQTLKFWRGTESEYNAITTKDNDTVYFIIND